MNPVPRSLLDRYPEIYIGLAAILLVLKALGVHPTSLTPWPAAILAASLCILMGALGLRRKYLT